MKKKLITSSWPCFTQEEAAKIQEILLSNKVNYWTGSECIEFEKEFAKFSDTKFAIALANGTVALDLALKGLDIGIGDEVIVTSRTFIASVSCIVNSGATPKFADVELDSQNICLESIKSLLSAKTKAILCVHLAGWPCNMEAICKFANENGLLVIEDCAQAHGAKFKGKSVGSFGDIGCWSFCQDKIITSGGEGGMVTTNDNELWKKMWSYKDHGKNYDIIKQQKSKIGFLWTHNSFGTNWRMTEVQAAIGRIQLKRIDEWNKKRRFNAEAIWNAVRGLPGIRVANFKCANCLGHCDTTTGCLHAAYKCYIFVENGEDRRDALIKTINEKGVFCSSGSCPEVYLEKAFDNTGLRPKKRLPNAKKLGATSLMFQCHPTLTENEIRITCDIIKESILDLNN